MQKIVSQITAAGTAHSNSTTEASLARKTFSAGELQPGKVFDIRGAARVTASNSTDTVTMALRFGTSTTVTSNTAVGSSAAVDAADSDVAIVDAKLEVQTATRAVISGYISDSDANGSKLMQEFMSILTIDASVPSYLDFTADWSVASSSNSIQAEQFLVTELV